MRNIFQFQWFYENCSLIYIITVVSCAVFTVFIAFVRKGTKNLWKSNCLLEPKVHGKALETNITLYVFLSGSFEFPSSTLLAKHYCFNILMKDFVQLKLLKLYQRQISKNHFCICWRNNHYLFSTNKVLSYPS